MKEKTSVKGIISVFLLFLGLFPAFAQETIAVHPLDNTANTPMARVFLDELVRTIPMTPGYIMVYRTHLIDLVNNRPADVPPGGFPSYICPPPSLTVDAPYAITGEVGEDADYPGEYWVRLYLWQTDQAQLLATDMVSASDRESVAENYPFLLAFLFSKIDEHVKMNQPIIAAGSPEPPPPPPQHIEPEPKHHISLFGDSWLFLGLRAGAGNATWKKEQVDNKAETDFVDFSFAFQAIVNLYYPLAIQTEANLHGHFAVFDMSSGGQGDENVPIIWNITVPLFVNINLYSGVIDVSIYGGPWLFFPIPLPQFFYEGDPNYDSWPSWKTSLGLSYGLTVGWRAGKNGCVFLDGRFNHLINYSGGYPLNGSTFSIGYQFGLIEKKK